jgi:hypothetical protein
MAIIQWHSGPKRTKDRDLVANARRIARSRAPDRRQGSGDWVDVQNRREPRMPIQTRKESIAPTTLAYATGKPHGIANDGGSWKRNWVPRTLHKKGEDLGSEQVNVNSGGEVDAAIDGNGNDPTASGVGHGVIIELCQGVYVPIEQDKRVIFGLGQVDNTFGHNIIALSEMSNRRLASRDILLALLLLLLLLLLLDGVDTVNHIFLSLSFALADINTNRDIFTVLRVDWFHGWKKYSVGGAGCCCDMFQRSKRCFLVVGCVVDSR